MQATLILISGGARSGKSRAALGLARQAGSKLLYVATAEAYDDEMRERIRRHKEERPDFASFEAPYDLDAVLQRGESWDAIIVDCLTLWLSNLIFKDLSDEECSARILKDLEALSSCCGRLILVSNEVGFGIVPDNALARRFRDANGLIQQKIAGSADEIYLAALGRILPLHKLGWAIP